MSDALDKITLVRTKADRVGALLSARTRVRMVRENPKMTLTISVGGATGGMDAAVLNALDTACEAELVSLGVTVTADP